jgi:hypothetical protein
MLEIAALFLRFRPETNSCYIMTGDIMSLPDFLSCMDVFQSSGLTEEEVEDRFSRTSPFCNESIINRWQARALEDSVPSLCKAASGSIAIFRHLAQAGADASFWLGSDVEISEVQTASSLAVTTPLHVAIKTRNVEMLEYLLASGYNPNIQALAAPSQCFTPLVATITLCHPWNDSAFELLSQQPRIDFNAITPIYKVHLLHFAVARLSLSLVQRVVECCPLENAPVTALGHTLLHVACMPLTRWHIQEYSQKVFESIHELRDISFDSQHFRFDNPPPRSSLYSHFGDHMELVKYLVSNNKQQITAMDIHGNTALHYLAGHAVHYRELIAWMRALPDGEYTWMNAYNGYNYTPKELYEESRIVSPCTHRFPPKFWAAQREVAGLRTQRKLEVWGELEKWHGFS